MVDEVIGFVSTRRGWSAFLTVLLSIVAAGWSSPARATEHGGPSNEWSTAVVSRLTIHDDGRGWLVIQTRLLTEEYWGFDVRVGAGDGSWSGPADVPVPALGIHCRLQAGVNLHYRCGRTRDTDPPQPFLSSGSYSVTIPVQRTGPVTGLTGSTHMYSFFFYWPYDPYVSSYALDTFPVYDASHFASTAEVPVARTDSVGGWVQEKVTTQVTVVPGENVTALDVPFGAGKLRLIGTNAARHGLQCYVREEHSSLHCKPATGRTGFLTGTYYVVADLDLMQTTTGLRYPSKHHVDLKVLGWPQQTIDTFGWMRQQSDWTGR